MHAAFAREPGGGELHAGAGAAGRWRWRWHGDGGWGVCGCGSGAGEPAGAGAGAGAGPRAGALAATRDSDVPVGGRGDGVSGGATAVVCGGVAAGGGDGGGGADGGGGVSEGVEERAGEFAAGGCECERAAGVCGQDCVYGEVCWAAVCRFSCPFPARAGLVYGRGDQWRLDAVGSSIGLESG